MTDDVKTLLAKFKTKMPDGASILGGSDLINPETTTAGRIHKVLSIYPDNTIYELTIEEWPDGFDILRDDKVGKIY